MRRFWIPVSHWKCPVLSCGGGKNAQVCKTDWKYLKRCENMKKKRYSLNPTPRIFFDKQARFCTMTWGWHLVVSSCWSWYPVVIHHVIVTSVAVVAIVLYGPPRRSGEKEWGNKGDGSGRLFQVDSPTEYSFAYSYSSISCTYCCIMCDHGLFLIRNTRRVNNVRQQQQQQQQRQQQQQ